MGAFIRSRAPGLAPFGWPPWRSVEGPRTLCHNAVMAGKKSPTASRGVLDAIGNTPMVPLLRLPGDGSGEVLVKLEYLNPSGSIKDRAAAAIIQDAEERGDLKPGGAIVEATSGNMGPALATVGAARGYRAVIVMPVDVPNEYKRRLTLLGAEAVFTASARGMLGAAHEAIRLVKENPGYVLADQFNNGAAVAAHRDGTAAEILRRLSGRAPDAFVAGVGSGATLSGAAAALKSHDPRTKAIAVEPTSSPVLSAGRAGAHRIHGIGANFVPAILDRSLIDETVQVSDEEAYSTATGLAQREGLFCGPSAGANVAAALVIAERMGAGSTVVTVLPDGGERYLRATV